MRVCEYGITYSVIIWLFWIYTHAKMTTKSTHCVCESVNFCLGRCDSFYFFSQKSNSQTRLQNNFLFCVSVAVWVGVCVYFSVTDRANQPTKISFWSQRQIVLFFASSLLPAIAPLKLRSLLHIHVWVWVWVCITRECVCAFLFSNFAVYFTVSVSISVSVVFAFISL